LHPTRCAICKTEGNATEWYPSTFAPEALTPEVFSARRLPDRVHYRIACCNTCGLVRSDPMAELETVAQLYRQSSFGYADELPGLKRTYGRYLARLDQFGVNKGALLEIGCGNGFFLEVALAQQYRLVRGVEPSRDAVSRASRAVADGIVCDVMHEGLFESETFDVICLFQVLDHIADPASLLDECFRMLKPGGVALILNHNVAAISAKILGEGSPIFDIEHTYLYSRETLARLTGASGFSTREAGTVWNTYSLEYITRLIPFPALIKRSLLALLRATPFGRFPLSVPLGNLYLVAQKPPSNGRS
jgi:2-polyprenyl-3-methyl-5-hydroxy-6-metoxy-1,4-benzoquinol methylase